MNDGTKGSRRRKGEILIMDCDQLTRALATGMIEHLGYAATTCSDGAEALTLYRKGLEEGNPFLAAVLDLEAVSGMGGQETVTKILAMDPDAHLVASTGGLNFPGEEDCASSDFCCVTRTPTLLPEIAKVLAHLASLIKVTKLKTAPL